MVEGKIAMHPSGDVQAGNIMISDMPGYALAVSKGINGFLPHFEKVPAQNEYFLPEVQVLQRIQEITEGLRDGRLSPEDRSFIFWMG